MKRKDYKKPAVKTVKLHAACHFLVGSDENARSYGTANSNVPTAELDENGEWVWK
jgi:3-oxoacyl-ACP reductase-like protein